MGVWLLGAAVFAQTTDKALRADRVVVLKKERSLQLLRQGNVIKTYKVALGADPVGPKQRQGDHKTPEGVYLSIRGTRIASSISRSTFRIQACGNALQHGKRASRRAETYLSMDCRRITGGWDRRTE